MRGLPSFRIGNYGDGTIGFKTATPGNDVLIRADDDDVTKRSFNSEWTNILKIKSIGIVQAVAQQWQSSTVANSVFYWYSGWKWVLPQVPTGLTYIPIWEERGYDSATKTFYDDDSGVANSHVYTGARSWFVPADTTVDMSRRMAFNSPAGADFYPSNTLVFDPNFRRSANPGLAGLSYNGNVYAGQPGQYIGYPPFPATPAPSAKAAYVLYSNSIDPGTPV